MELIVMLGLGLYALFTGCACCLCYLLGMARGPVRGKQGEPPAEPAAQDPAQILKEWLYGGDNQ